MRFLRTVVNRGVSEASRYEHWISIWDLAINLNLDFQRDGLADKGTSTRFHRNLQLHAGYLRDTIRHRNILKSLTARSNLVREQRHYLHHSRYIECLNFLLFQSF